MHKPGKTGIDTRPGLQFGLPFLCISSGVIVADQNGTVALELNSVVCPLIGERLVERQMPEF